MEDIAVIPDRHKYYWGYSSSVCNRKVYAGIVHRL